MVSEEAYIEKEKKRVAKLNKKGFSKQHLVEWYIKQLESQKHRCFYCDTSIHDINKLIALKKLRVRKTGTGARGPVLEIDKKDNDLGYSEGNCVLSCYYCNNDKSYTIGSNDYKKYFGDNRKKYFDELLSISKT